MLSREAREIILMAILILALSFTGAKIPEMVAIAAALLYLKVEKE